MSIHKDSINICWLRRDLRLTDNAALHHALKSENPVVVLFIFDTNILDQLNDKKDARVTFIHQELSKIDEELRNLSASLLVEIGSPEKVWPKLVKDFNIKSVFTNRDYEPYATKRDDDVAEFLRSEDVSFQTFKDHVIFERNEVTKADGKPYTVFTPYYRQWLKKLDDFYFKSYPTKKYFKNFYQYKSFKIPSLKELGFEKSTQEFPSERFVHKLDDYADKRDFPADKATTRIGLHLRFGTLSIRQVLQKALEHKAHKWISELVWRDFYAMILYHFPKTVDHAFKPDYDKIKWLNDEKEFKAWCEGKTGYPIVDAGMRQLNETGFMHNRVRMVVASFLCKHLLIDWRWGEAYFAEKLLDYDQASNIGGWQWACGSGNDAAPYFRVFNPELQLKKFDPKMKYVFEYAPEYKNPLTAPQPIVEHTFARDRVLKAYKKALG